jgi:hypothetical protein
MNISVEPYQKITIRSYLEHQSPQAFVDAITLPLVKGTNARMGGLLWANGVLFRNFPYAPTDSVTKEYLKGHLLIDLLEFAPMSEYTKEIRNEEFVVTVTDVSNHITLRELAMWVANNLLIKKSKRKRK